MRVSTLRIPGLLCKIYAQLRDEWKNWVEGSFLCFVWQESGIFASFQCFWEARFQLTDGINAVDSLFTCLGTVSQSSDVCSKHGGEDSNPHTSWNHLYVHVCIKPKSESLNNDSSLRTRNTSLTGRGKCSWSCVRNPQTRKHQRYGVIYILYLSFIFVHYLNEHHKVYTT